MLNCYRLKTKLPKLLFLVMLLYSFQASAQYPVQTPVTTDVDYVIKGYYEWLPPDYASQPSKSYPLLIFFHGIGEIGNGKSQLPKVLVNGPPKLINQKLFPTSFTVGGQNFSFIVLSPQCSSSARDPQIVQDMIDYAKKKYRVDASRIYLTGLSMGGGLSWLYVGQKPAYANTLAAFAEVCGNTMAYPSSVKIIANANLPVKGFHNSGDPTVPVSYTINWINELNAFLPPINPPAEMTIFNANSHDAWSRAYDPNYKENGMNVYEWMLQYKRGGNGGPANKVPVANAGPDQSVSLPGNSVTVDGGSSYDPDGTISSFSWTKISGPSTFSITTPNAAQTTIRNLVLGTYTFLLTVTDAQGATTSDEVVINVLPAANQPPIANAGADQNITLPANSVSLNGSASVDPNGSITGYAWTQISGPSTATIVSPLAAISQVNGLGAGTYVFKLTVKDAGGASDADSITVVVKAAPNIAPVADAGADQVITLPVNTASLNGNKSKDADGTISKYSWAQISGPSPASIASPQSVSTQVTGMLAGQYTFELTVTDNLGLNAKDQVKVTVNAAPNTPPTANAGSNQAITLPTNTVTLNGSASSDLDGSIVSYAWSELSGPAMATISNAGKAVASASGLNAGQYVFELIVTDDKGASSQSQVKITVSAAPNQPPLANAGPGKAIVLPVNSVSLSGTASSDPDGSITSYLWVQISGPSSATLTNAGSSIATASDLVAGQYVFGLTVTDNLGATGKAQTKITVSPAANQSPVANAGAAQVITLPTNSASLDGTASYDPNGALASYTWTQDSGPSQATLSNATKASANVSGMIRGLYTFKLVVTDAQGSTATDYTTITVNAAPNQTPIADAGTNIVISLPANTAALNGSASKDPDGSIVSYTWSQASGPNTALITNATSVRPAVSGLVKGSYVFKLVVTDNSGATASDNVTVTVNASPNKPPVALAGANQTIVLPQNTAELDGSASQDPDGNLAGYAWTQVSGPSKATIASPAKAITEVSALVQGSYVFNLEVSDSEGATSQDQVTVTVEGPANQSPIANAGQSTTITLPASNFSLDGSKSTDPDGSIVSYQWSEVSGPSHAAFSNASVQAPVISNLVTGQYIFRLTVTDNDGASSYADVKISVVAAPDQAPIANAGQDISITLPQSSVTLDGSRSFDPDGTISKYSWQKLQGPDPVEIAGSESAVAVVSGLQEGQYTFELAVWDQQGVKSSDLIVVTVNAGARAVQPDLPPVADAGRDTTVLITANRAFLDGSASSDPDGEIVSYEWTQIEGPQLATIVSSGSAQTAVNDLQAGSYVFLLTVTDDEGATDTASVRITVSNNQRYVEQVILFPNPARDIVNFKLTSDSVGLVRINIYDLSGKLVRSMQMEKTQEFLLSQFNVSGFAGGMYTVQFIIGTNRRLAAKLIKQ